VDPREFWYGNSDWHLVGDHGHINPCAERSNSLFEVYRYRRANFTGHVRLQWVPSQNYHTQAARSASASGHRIAGHAEMID
jgi:hypothetical protein